MFIAMTVHYFFIGEEYDILYFLKEYFLLISYTYICYFFLYQMYTLFERHIFLTYLGMITLVLVIIYITVLGFYFILVEVVVNTAVFDCSSEFWLMISSSGFLLSILFIAIGIVVQQNLKSKQILYLEQVMKKVKDLKILISVFTITRIVSFTEAIVLVVTNSENCMIYTGGNIGASIFLFILFTLITDYTTIFIVIYQIYKSMKIEVEKTISDSNAPSELAVRLPQEFISREVGSSLYN
ncbi:hypothetical protein SteCoe_4750 [Stentor coeruleus]|uniref:THH1/TOM1/TOM3 domain-containing protein n=1 Tax=Stentor coeruleus TaxID=5963 RepID=A0A1R2CU65_9CILI|nr:hypothetical protein SteCoe_4750 [Stentor coeruleus]